jgi:hypothetical protein
VVDVAFVEAVWPYAVALGFLALALWGIAGYRRANERIAESVEPADDLKRADDGSGYDSPGPSIGSFWNNT